MSSLDEALTMLAEIEILEQRRDLEGALELRAEVEALFREAGSLTHLRDSLMKHAALRNIRGEYELCDTAFAEHQEVCLALEDEDGFHESLQTQARWAESEGALDRALLLFARAAEISRERGATTWLIRALHSQGLVKRTMDDLPGAIALFEEEVALARETGESDRVYRAVGNLASTLTAAGMLDRALELHHEEERLCRELEDRAGLYRALDNQALNLRARGQFDEALRLHREARSICEGLGDPAGLTICLGNVTTTLRAAGRHDEADRAFEELLAILRAQGDPRALIRAYFTEAEVNSEIDRPERAAGWLAECVGLLRELGDQAALSAVLGNLANALHGAGDLEGAIGAIAERAELAEALGLAPDACWANAFHATLLLEDERADAALRALDHAEALAVRHDVTETRASLMSTRGDVLRALGDWDGALDAYRELERLVRDAGDPGSRIHALTQQAEALRELGRVDETPGLLSRVVVLARDLETERRHQYAGQLAAAAGEAYEGSELEWALAVDEAAERLFSSVRDATSSADSLARMTTALLTRDPTDPERALDLATRQLTLAEEIDDAAYLARAHWLVGRSHGALGNVDRQIAALACAEAAAEGRPDLVRLAHVAAGDRLLAASPALAESGDMEGLTRTMREMAEHLEAANDVHRLADCLHSFFSIFAQADQPERALEAARRAEANARDHDLPAPLMRALASQAFVLQQLGDDEESLRLALEHEQAARSIGSDLDLVIALYNQAEICFDKLDRPAEALPRLDEAAALAVRLDQADISSQIEDLRRRVSSAG